MKCYERETPTQNKALFSVQELFLFLEEVFCTVVSIIVCCKLDIGMHNMAN